MAIGSHNEAIVGGDIPYSPMEVQNTLTPLSSWGETWLGGTTAEALLWLSSQPQRATTVPTYETGLS